MIKRLEKQTLKPNRIIIMNTEEKYFEKLLYGTDFARGFSFSRGVYREPSLKSCRTACRWEKVPR